MSWQKQQGKLRNIIKRQEDALGTRRTPVIPAGDFWAALEQQQSQRFLQALADEEERNRVASEAHKARQKAMADTAQVRQREWAARRDELCARVVEVERALSGAESQIHSGDMDIAIRGAAEAPVYRARLESAQRAYADHLRPRGFTPHAPSATR